MKAFLNRIQSRAFAPIDIASLVFFRIAFGLLMVWEVCRYFKNESVYHYWLEPKFLFKYYGFSWIHPWPGDWLYIHWAILGVLALFVAFGFFYRISAALMFLSYAYFFLLDEARYVNHTYLICLYCLLLAIVPAHRSFSIDSRLRPSLRSDTAPAWTLWLLRFQIAVVYIFAGLVKLSPDWLRGEPMRYQLSHATSIPIIGPFLGTEWAVYLVCYGGLILDLFVVPGLLWKRTRVAAFCAVVFFHVTNALWAVIGMFPWLAIAATALFFPPEWPRRILQKLELVRRRKTLKESKPASALQRSIILTGLSVYVAIQLFLPLRHLLYRGGVEWTGAEHRFSWRMFIWTYASIANFYVTNPNTGPKPLQVQARIYVAINGRKPTLYIDPVVDLAAEPRPLGRPKWLLRNDEPLPPKGERYRMDLY